MYSVSRTNRSGCPCVADTEPSPVLMSVTRNCPRLNKANGEACVPLRLLLSLLMLSEKIWEPITLVTALLRTQVFAVFAGL